MAVKAKFKCDSVTDFGKSKQVNLTPVTTGSKENLDYAMYTPSGELRLRIDNETKASSFFVPGKEYYLTIEEANSNSSN